MEELNYFYLVSLVIVKIFGATCSIWWAKKKVSKRGLTMGAMKQDILETITQPGVFLARLGLLIKKKKVSQSEQQLSTYIEKSSVFS